MYLRGFLFSIFGIEEITGYGQFLCVVGEILRLRLLGYQKTFGPKSDAFHEVSSCESAPELNCG